jgi:hypothetical protein
MEKAYKETEIHSSKNKHKNAELRKNLCYKLEGQIQRKYKKDRKVEKCKTVGKVEKERQSRKIYKINMLKLKKKGNDEETKIQ